ncbi:hypothetical protein C3R44_21275, partial [Mycobacterium tuberculosis]
DPLAFGVAVARVGLVPLLRPLAPLFARLAAPRPPLPLGAFAVFALPPGAPRRFLRALSAALSPLAFLP